MRAGERDDITVERTDQERKTSRVAERESHRLRGTEWAYESERIHATSDEKMQRGRGVRGVSMSQPRPTRSRTTKQVVLPQSELKSGEEA